MHYVVHRFPASSHARAVISRYGRPEVQSNKSAMAPKKPLICLPLRHLLAFDPLFGLAGR